MTWAVLQPEQNRGIVNTHVAPADTGWSLSPSPRAPRCTEECNCIGFPVSRRSGTGNGGEGWNQNNSFLCVLGECRLKAVEEAWVICAWAWEWTNNTQAIFVKGFYLVAIMPAERVIGQLSSIWSFLPSWWFIFCSECSHESWFIKLCRTSSVSWFSVNTNLEFSLHSKTSLCKNLWRPYITF